MSIRPLLTLAATLGLALTGLTAQPASAAKPYFEHITVDQTVTGEDSVVTIRLHSAYIQKDLKLRDDGAGTFTIIALLTGPARVYGPDGKIISRDPGQVRLRIEIFDNGTPDDPTDDIETVTQIKGSTGRNDDFCGDVVPVIS